MTITIVQQDINPTTDAIVNVSIATALGYLCSRSFQLINPLHGALFCAVSSVVSSVVRPIFAEIFAGSDRGLQMIGDWMRFGVSVGASALLATAAGFPITVSTGLVLTGSVIASEIIFKLGYILLATKV